jgi:hypothetical protein
MANGAKWPSHWYGHGVWNLPDPFFPCRKDKFKSKAEAKLAIKRVRAEMANWRRKEGRATAYKCSNCGLWHWGHKREPQL